MKNSYYLSFLGIALLVSVAACNDENSETTTTTNSTETRDTTNMMNNGSGNSNMQEATATLSGTKADTTVSGSARFEQLGNGVRMTLQVSIPKMANQTLAAHIHENGDCGNNGEAAGGHWNPTNEQHGKWGEGNFHSGDFGNIQFDGSGNGSLQIESDRWTIGGDQNTNILNRAIIIHSGRDDFRTQPSGNAGQRIGCGVITQGAGQR